jgi:hypothetical protein
MHNEKSYFGTQNGSLAICRIEVVTNGRIILRGIFRKWEGVVGTGWSGLRIGTGGGHL